jgi:predicted metalloendopeptidase
VWLDAPTRTSALEKLSKIDFSSVSIRPDDYFGNTQRIRSFPLLHLNAFHTAFGARPGDPMWRSPEQRVQIW